MHDFEQIWQTLVTNGFKVSTDTRHDLTGKVFFGLKGDNFDGSNYGNEALSKGATMSVTDNALEAIQTLARRYRDTFNIPIIAIGGSNGKTTTKELSRIVLETSYKTYATPSNFNNHIGLPLSIFSLDKGSEVGIFEIGANHLGEHTSLLEILNPTHVIVTNSGMDHLEGFGSPSEVIKANDEINIWANKHGAVILSNENHGLKVTTSLPLTVTLNNRDYKTQMFGDYNLENINRAITIGQNFKIEIDKTLVAITRYSPSANRSQIVVKDGIRYVVDCYNANPSSMMLALESFIKSTESPRGIVLGDMLELGSYTEQEHKKILDYISEKKLNSIVLVGENFKQALEGYKFKYQWFPDSDIASKWFKEQHFANYTFLLKGSRGIKIEKILQG